MSNGRDGTGWLEERRDRRSFLKQFGSTMAVGVGLAALPAQAAHAQTKTRVQKGADGKEAVLLACGQCCKDASCPGCGGSPVHYRCFDNCCGTNCCVCLPDQGQCVSLGGPICC